MNIYLIRHGKKTDDTKNHEKLELTGRGYKQANLLGQRLENYNIDRIYSSDMVRAVQTSQEINKFTKVDIEIDHDLREIDMGDFVGRERKYVEEKYPEFAAEFYEHTSDVPYPEGECGEEVWERSKAAFSKITSSGLENVAVVAHGGVIRAFVAGILGLSQEKRFALGLPLKNCSLTIIKYDVENDKYYLQCFNDYSHLILGSDPWDLF